MSEEQSKEGEDRRAFLAAAGKFALIVPPAMTVLLSTTMNSNAIAQSSGHFNRGLGNGSEGGDPGNSGGNPGNAGEPGGAKSQGWAPDRPFWWRSRLVRSKAVATLAVGDSRAVFCERTQRLSALNETAWRIWQGLDGGGSCAEAAADLEALGAAPEEARAFIESAATQWLQAGYFAPQEILDLSRSAPRSLLHYRAAQLSFALCYFGDAVPAAGASAFAGLSRPSGEPDATFDIVGDGGFVFLLLDDAALGMFSPDEIAAALKAQVTEHLCRSITDGFLTHAGLVAANGRRILLSGAPGAGKTTLTLALAGSGFAYGGDDIVHVCADGSAVGVPFAAAAKEGAWPLLQAHCPGLSDLPICPRADGKLTRYVTPALLDRDGPQPIDVVLLLAREPGAKARLEPVAALDAVCVLLDSSFSPRGSLRAEVLQAFGASIAKAACRRLVYEDLDAAVSAVRELADE